MANHENDPNHVRTLMDSTHLYEGSGLRELEPIPRNGREHGPGEVPSNQRTVIAASAITTRSRSARASDLDQGTI
jgi:hypothetical protein